MNKDTSCGRDYHEKTKHSEISVMTSGHYLDWNNRPSPFKIYTELPTIPLPLDFSMPSMNSIWAISGLYPQLEQSEDHDYNVDTNVQFSKDIDYTKQPILYRYKIYPRFYSFQGGLLGR